MCKSQKYKCIIELLSSIYLYKQSTIRKISFLINLDIKHNLSYSKTLKKNNNNKRFLQSKSADGFF